MARFSCSCRIWKPLEKIWLLLCGLTKARRSLSAYVEYRSECSEISTFLSGLDKVMAELPLFCRTRTTAPKKVSALVQLGSDHRRTPMLLSRRDPLITKQTAARMVSYDHELFAHRHGRGVCDAGIDRAVSEV